MNKGYFEPSNDLGAGDFRTFAKVKLPLSIPGITSTVRQTITCLIERIAAVPIAAAIGRSIKSR